MSAPNLSEEFLFLFNMLKQEDKTTFRTVMKKVAKEWDCVGDRSKDFAKVEIGDLLLIKNFPEEYNYAFYIQVVSEIIARYNSETTLLGRPDNGVTEEYGFFECEIQDFSVEECYSKKRIDFDIWFISPPCETKTIDIKEEDIWNDDTLQMSKSVSKERQGMPDIHM